MTDTVLAGIRVDCERCGAVEIAIADARLVMAAAPVDEGGHNLVEYTCPGCGRPGSIRVDDRVTRLIMATDVTLVLPTPAEQTPHKPVGRTPEER